jgi:hypothetical protein
METLITFRVLNQDWLDMSKEDREYFKHLKEPEDLQFMKYESSFSFTFTFDVLNYTVNANASFEHNGTVLSDYYEVVFKGESLSNNVIVSKSLLATEFTARKSGGKQYCYFFIKPDVSYHRMSHGLWLDDDAFEAFNKLTDENENETK